jgi:hypothetical protein
MPETVMGKLQDVTATKLASLADSLDWQAWLIHWIGKP